MSNRAEPAMQILDALEEASQEMERHARLVRDRLSRNGFSASELQIMRRVLQEKQAFYTQSHLVGLALEQWLDETAPIAVTTKGVYAAILAMQEAQGDLTCVEAVAKKIEKALKIVVDLAARMGLRVS